MAGVVGQLTALEGTMKRFFTKVLALAGIVSRAAIETQGLDLVPPSERDSGNGWLRHKTVEVSADVATDGAATTLEPEVPDGAKVLSVHFEVVTEIADIDSTTGTLSFADGSTTDVGTISAFAAGTKLTKITDEAISGDVGNLTFTLSGGSDNTPSGGSIRAVLHYVEATAL